MPLTFLPVGVCLVILFSQPDLGMVAVVGLVFAIQLFLAGIPWAIVIGLNVVGAGGAWLAYTLFPHVSRRIDSFLDPNTVGYQVEMALRAVASGGLLGRGPGEGIEKFLLPDAHTDFVFAAAAEEFGILACLVIAALFAALLLRCLWRINETNDRFVQIAAAGLVSQFALQALINMAVNLNLDPDQGHDPALHQLRRLVDDRARLRDGHAAGPDAARRPAGGGPVSALAWSSPPAARAATCSRPWP